jgi:hypothetical protein
MIIAALILFATQAQQVPNITKPQTQLVVGHATQQVSPIATPTHRTTPGLTKSSDIRSTVEFVMGSQEERVVQLQAKVSTLETNRSQIDRPDIDHLKTSRMHVIWVGSFLLGGVTFAITLIGYFRHFLWKSSLPWLREELRGNRHPPTASALDLTEL